VLKGNDMRKTDKVSHASVKVMRSYDYCHFEVVLGVDQPVSIHQIDMIRKEANRLVDKAVEQYKVAKKAAEEQYYAQNSAKRLEKEAEAIKENFPMSEWTPEQQAKVKAYGDAVFRASLYYDYEDDWDCD
jgi:glycogen debranching enzyme